MTKDQSSYRQIFKATSIFGGVQLFNILISIIKSKFIAVLLGPTGMGIAGLLTATTGLTAAITNFGLGTSAVKDVSAAYATGDKLKIAEVIGVFRRLVWFTGLLGTIVTLLFSPWLSQITFGNSDYTVAFIWISITLLFNQLTTSRLVLLQGMRQLQPLAKANLTGNFVGLIIIIPIYYYFKLDGIVPGIIITAIISFVLAWLYSNKIEIEKVDISNSKALGEGKKMLFLGFMISMSGLLTMGTSYLLRIFIRHKGGIDQVGLYNAGFVLLNTYVGLVFSAMATDYFPRLSANAQDDTYCKKTINEQAEIALLLLTPLILVLMIFVHWVVIILYSENFFAIESMIYWSALGMLFRAASWSISFVFMAKGDAKLFFWNELLANLYMLGVNVIGYFLYGLEGMGIAFLVGYIFYLIQVFVISYNKYNFRFNYAFIKIFLVQIVISIGCLFIVKLFIAPLNYAFGIILLAFCVFFSYIELNKRININAIILKFKNKT